EYLYRIRNLLKNDFNISILSNLESFPIDLDPSLREYHEKIANKINNINHSDSQNYKTERYTDKFKIESVRQLTKKGEKNCDVNGHRQSFNRSKKMFSHI
ncbi:hypothetical protein MXZ85_17940, partial [Acinetobacter baumannii]|uniref:hypothetical protein n=1 Tax=Acinetobacter baumannii TaxID=470 RepID=UPI001FF6D558